MKFVCEKNRMEWIGNPGPSLRRGEVFEMAKGERTKIWLEQGYISVYEPEPEPEPVMVPESESESELEPEPDPEVELEPEPDPEVELDEEKLEEAPIGKAAKKKVAAAEKKLKTAELPAK